MKNKILLEEINRFRMMTNYQPGKLLNEQKYNLLNEEIYQGAYDIIWMESGGNQNDLQTSSNDRSGYMNETIGTIVDDVLTLNEIGNFIFDKRKYSKTIVDVELLEKQGKLRITKQFSMDDYSKLSKKDGDKLKTKNNKSKDDLSRRDTRKNTRAYVNYMGSAIDAAGWNMGNSGTMILNSEMPAAFGVGENNGYLWVSSMAKFEIDPPKGPDGVPFYSGKTEPGDTVDEFNIGRNTNAYPSNIVKPKLEGGAKEEFDMIVDEFVNYIKNGGLKNLTNVTIQGTADASNPTWNPPAGYTTIDHTYGGMRRPTAKQPQTQEELEEMNIYLARYRAINYANKLIEEIEKQTGERIVIKQLEPISYLGQSGKKGSQWRTINLTANAPILDVIQIDPIKKKEYEDYIKRKSDYERGMSSGMYPVTVSLTINGKYSTITTNSDGTPNALSVTKPSSNGEYTTKAVYVRKDLVEQYGIPKSPDTVINGVTFNESSKKLSFTDEDGSTQTFTMGDFDGAGNYGNVISIANANQSMEMSKYMGSYGADDNYDGYNVKCLKLGTNIPFTTNTGKLIKYEGLYYVEVTNYWFAYNTYACSNSPGKINYRRIATLSEY